MPANEIRLAQMLGELKRAKRSSGLPEKSPLIQVEQTKVEMSFEILAAETLVRGPSPYKVMPRNLVIPGEKFETDLTGWTDNVDAVGATSWHDILDEHTYIKYPFGAMGGLKMDMTGSSATNKVVGRIYEDIVVVAAQVYSCEMWLAAVALTANVKGVLRMRWYNSSPTEVGTADEVDITSSSVIPVLTQLLNKTAPATAVSVDIEVELRSTAAAGVGTMYASRPLLHNLATIEAYATRLIPAMSTVGT